MASLMKFLFLAAIVIAILGFRSGSTSTTRQPVRFFLLPDIQALVANRGAPESDFDDLLNVARWVCTNAQQQNIVAVLNLGDMVEAQSSTFQWARTAQLAEIFEACGLPYLATIGNHDIAGGGSNCITSSPLQMWPQRYEQYFGPNGSTPREQRIGFRERGPDIVNNHPNSPHPSGAYWIQTNHSRYAAITLPWCAFAGSPNSVALFAPTIAWLDGIVKANSTKLFFVVSHFHGEDFPVVGDLLSQAAADFFNNNPNVIAFSSGHQLPLPFTNLDLATVGGCVDCLVTSGFNYDTNDASLPTYNVQARVVMDSKKRMVCYRNLKIENESEVSFDYDGAVETCSFFRTYDVHR